MAWEPGLLASGTCPAGVRNLPGLHSHPESAKQVVGTLGLRVTMR